MKNRGVKDILILYSDGLSGIKESINVAFPNTEYQRCLVHQVWNKLRYVTDKYKKICNWSKNNIPCSFRGTWSFQNAWSYWEVAQPLSECNEIIVW